MKKTPVKIIEHAIEIDHEKPICFIGSCFSDEISEKCKNSGFKVLANPFGVIFNPISIAELIHRTIDNIDFSDTILTQSNVYLSWLANRTVFAYDQTTLLSQLEQHATSFRKNLANTNAFFITLGTACAYKRTETGQIVANCHKKPSRSFQKIMLSHAEIVECYQKLLNKLKNEFPHLNVIFTVSPVRHVKDGLIENNLSKAHLLAAVHQLTHEFDFVHYFPTYELVLDELRDYAYYKADGIHPNEFAIEKIWNAFNKTYISNKTVEVLNDFERLSQQVKHKQLHEASDEAKLFKEKLKHQLREFQTKHPNVQLTEAMKDCI